MESSTPPSAAGYEFNTAENETISKAARWIGFWSWVSIGGGVFIGLATVFGESGVTDMVVGLVMATIYLVIGFYFRGTAGSMKSVVDTAGNDISHLMTALEKLASAFKVMGMLVIVMVVFVVLAIVIAGGMAVAGGG